MWCVAFAPLLPPKVAKKKGDLVAREERQEEQGEQERQERQEVQGLLSLLSLLFLLFLVLAPLFTGIFFDTREVFG